MKSSLELSKVCFYLSVSLKIIGDVEDDFYLD